MMDTCQVRDESRAAAQENTDWEKKKIIETCLCRTLSLVFIFRGEKLAGSLVLARDLTYIIITCRLRAEKSSLSAQVNCFGNTFIENLQHVSHNMCNQLWSLN